MKDEDIFDILDGVPSDEIIRKHKKMLKESADYQVLFGQYAQTNALLLDTSMEKTAFNFTDKLIDRWEVSQEVVVEKKSNKLPIYFLIGMSIIGILLIILVLPIIGQSKGQINLSKPLSILQENLFTRLLLIINVLVALFLIDIRFLKPYFQRRMGLK